MKIYAYVDNSNVFIEGQRVSAVAKGMALDINDAINRHIFDYTWQLDYGRLFSFVCGDKKDVEVANLWGSPPPGDTFWQMVESKGWKVETFAKSPSGKEKKVDVAIAHAMTKHAYSGKIDKKNSEIVLVAGDKDFEPVITDLRNEGYKVCIVFWKHVAGELKRAASSYTNMNPWLKHLQFTI